MKMIIFFIETGEINLIIIYIPKRHFEIGENLNLMNFELATKLSGTRFVVLKGMLAKLERAISQFMLDKHTS